MTDNLSSHAPNTYDLIQKIEHLLDIDLNISTEDKRIGRAIAKPSPLPDKPGVIR